MEKPFSPYSGSLHSSDIDRQVRSSLEIISAAKSELMSMPSLRNSQVRASMAANRGIRVRQSPLGERRIPAFSTVKAKSVRRSMPTLNRTGLPKTDTETLSELL